MYRAVPFSDMEPSVRPNTCSLNQDTRLPRVVQCIPGEIIYPRESIDQAATGLAEKIVGEWIQKSRIPVQPLVIMRGGFQFGAKLLPEIASLEPGPLVQSVDSITASSYNLENLRGELSFSSFHPLTLSNIKGKRVLLIDDICDEGKTLRDLVKYIANSDLDVSEVKAVTLIRRKRDDAVFAPDWVGFEHSGSEWLFGGGMDYHDQYRALPDIYAAGDSLLPAEGMISELGRFRGGFCGSGQVNELQNYEHISFSEHMRPEEQGAIRVHLERHGNICFEGEKALIAWEQMIEGLRISRSETGQPQAARILPAEVTARGLLMTDVASKLLYELSKAAGENGHEVIAEGVYFNGSFFRGRIDAHDVDISVVCSTPHNTPCKDYPRYSEIFDFVAKYTRECFYSSSFAGLGIDPQTHRMKWQKEGFKINVLVGTEPTKNRPLIEGTSCSQLSFFRGQAQGAENKLRPIVSVFVPLTTSDCDSLCRSGRRI